MDLFSVHSVLQ